MIDKLQNTSPAVVCAADNRYAMPLAVMLSSMELNLRTECSIDVWVLDGGVSWWNKKKVMRSLTTGRLILHWVKVEPAVLKGCPVFGHVSLATYYRVLMADILPSNIEKVLYIDLDVLVVGDIGQLLGVELGTSIILAVRESGNATLEKGLLCYKKLGLPGDAPYFNAGVLLVNLEVWRAKKFSTKLINFLSIHKAEIVWWDQDAMNALFYNHWADLRWDDLVSCAPVASKIIHFAGASKPWHYGAQKASADLYFRYLDNTSWMGWRPCRPMRTINRHEFSAAVASLPLVGVMWSVLSSGVMRIVQSISDATKKCV